MRKLIEFVAMTFCSTVLICATDTRHYVFDTRRPASAGSDRVSLSVATNQSTYTQGEPIPTAISVVNRTSSNLAVAQVTPWEAVHLIVFRHDGQQIDEPRQRNSGHWHMPLDVILKPGQTFTYPWRANATERLALSMTYASGDTIHFRREIIRLWRGRIG